MRTRLRFESRAGTGLLVFGLAWIASLPSTSELVAATGVLLLGGLLAGAAYHLHYGLAKYRHRRFKSSSNAPHFTGVGEVVLHWKRGKHAPPIKRSVRFRVGMSAVKTGARMLRASFSED